MAFSRRDNDNDNMRVDCALDFKGSVVNFAKFNDASLYSRIPVEVSVYVWRIYTICLEAVFKKFTKKLIIIYDFFQWIPLWYNAK